MKLKKTTKYYQERSHPWKKFKQNVSLALDIFNDTTIAAITSYFPDRIFSNIFLISNSKNRFSFSNCLNNATRLKDEKRISTYYGTVLEVMGKFLNSKFWKVYFNFPNIFSIAKNLVTVKSFVNKRSPW